jgi:hypothetical protein
MNSPEVDSGDAGNRIVATGLNAGRDISVTQTNVTNNAVVKNVDYWKYITDYLDFLIVFTKNPRLAMDEFRAEGHIDRKLCLFTVLSVVLPYLIIIPLNAMGICLFCDDPSYIVKTLKAIDIRLLPFTVLVAILILGIVLHILLRFGILYYDWVHVHPPNQTATGFKSAPYLGGNIQDTINAALGFTSFYIPYVIIAVHLLTGIVLGAFIIFEIDTHAITLVTILIIMLVGAILIYGPFFYHFPTALSATHQTSYWQALISIIFGFGVLMLVSSWAFPFLKKVIIYLSSDPVILRKGISGASIPLMILFGIVIRKIKGKQYATSDFIYIMIGLSIVALFFGWIGTIIPTIYSPWINYIAFPVLLFVLLGIILNRTMK